MTVAVVDRLVAERTELALENDRLRSTLELIAGFTAEQAGISQPMARQFIDWATDALENKSAGTVAAVPAQNTTRTTEVRSV